MAPLLMKAIVNRVLSLEPSVREATSSFVDDILVREDLVSAERVRAHLAKFGLLTKEPERVSDGTRLLGLSVWRERDKLLWRTRLRAGSGTCAPEQEDCVFPCVGSYWVTTLSADGFEWPRLS